MNFNLSVIIGTVSDDPKIRSIASKSSPGEELQIANFSIATNEYRTVDNEKIKKTTWHNIVVYNRKLIGLMENIKKGSAVTVFGKITTRKKELQDNSIRNITEIIASNVVLERCSRDSMDTEHEDHENHGPVNVPIQPLDEFTMNANFAMVSGAVGQDPRIWNRISTKDSTKELQIANFSIATNEYRTVDNEKTKKTTWHNIVVYDSKLIDLMQYIKKGSTVTVSGKLTTRKRDIDNQVQYITEIIAANIALGPKKAPSSNSFEYKPTNQQNKSESSDSSEDGNIIFEDNDTQDDI